MEKLLIKKNGQWSLEKGDVIHIKDKYGKPEHVPKHKIMTDGEYQEQSAHPDFDYDYVRDHHGNVHQKMTAGPHKGKYYPMGQNYGK